MDDLRKRAKQLLETSEVRVVIGYEQGTANKTRALLFEKPEDAGRLYLTAAVSRTWQHMLQTGDKR